MPSGYLQQLVWETPPVAWKTSSATCLHKESGTRQRTTETLEAKKSEERKIPMGFPTNSEDGKPNADVNERMDQAISDIYALLWRRTLDGKRDYASDDQYLKKDYPSKIYHYTSAEGLFGIITNDCLQATDVNFMNDYGETKYGFDLVNDRLNSLVARYAHNPNCQRLLTNLQGKVCPFSTPSPKDKPKPSKQGHAFCFSERKDSLPQWKFYARGGNGYAIGFSTDRFIKTGLDGDRIMLLKVLYDRKCQEEIADTLISKLIDAICPITTEEPIDQRVGSDLERWMRILTHVFTARIKSSDFEHEGEWRLVNGESYDGDLKFRVSSNIVLPYVEFFASDQRHDRGNGCAANSEVFKPIRNRAKLPISSVTIGKLIPQDMGNGGLRLLLASHGYSDVEIGNSQITIRF